MIRRAVAALVCALAIVVGSGGVLVAPAAAQATPSLVLAGQSAWIKPGDGFLMRLSATNVPPGAQVAVTVHDALTSRTAFDASIDGNNLPPTRDRQKFAFDELVADPATGQRLLAYTSTALGGGVFPVEVDLRSAADESLAHFVTHAVVAPVNADGALTVGQPLNVAWVWPLQAEPAYVAGKISINPTTLGDVSPTGRLGRQAEQLAANTDVPLTIAPSPETLDAWDDFGASKPELADGALAIRSTIARNQFLTGPFVPLNVPSVLRSGLPSDLVNSELRRGVSTLETFLGAHVDPSTALPGPLDAASLSLLSNASVRQLVVEGDALEPVNEKFTPAHPYKMRVEPDADSSAVTVVATDTELEKFLTGDEPPALRAAHLLAGLAVVAGEQPSLARGVALTNPVHWNADDTFVSAVLAGLRGNPLLRPTTVEGLLDVVPAATANGQPDGEPVYRELAPYSAPAPPVNARQYAEGVQSRAAVADLVGTTNALTLRAERALATSLATEWTTPNGRTQARQLLTSIRGSVNDYLSRIQVQPNNTNITITSSKAEIPISFRNTGDDPITVHVKLDSDRLVFPAGDELEVPLPAHHNTTVRIAVETRGSGTSPVVLTATTPGGLTVGKTTIKVRSTFVSGVGVFLTVGAIVFLALWWGWDIHRRRKKRALGGRPTSRLAPPAGQPA